MSTLKHISNTAAPGADPDAALIARMAERDQSALSELMERHAERVQALNTRLLSDIFMAEDVTQSVFLKTWQIAPTWQYGRAKLLTWMLRISTHQCLDILRKASPEYTSEPPDMHDDRPDGEDKIIQTEQNAHIDALIAALPYTQRTALTLSYFEGLSQKQACEIMDISVSAYQSLLARARRTLKAHIPDHISEQYTNKGHI